MLILMFILFLLKASDRQANLATPRNQVSSSDSDNEKTQPHSFNNSPSLEAAPVDVKKELSFIPLEKASQDMTLQTPTQTYSWKDTILALILFPSTLLDFFSELGHAD